MKKKDGVLLLFILAIVIVLSAFPYSGRGTTGEMIHILIDGELYGTYSMSVGQEIQIENDQGYNCIIIEQGQVHMKEADCPDGYCVAHKAISKTNETIVCLPHKLVVEVHGNDTEVIDSVTQ